MKTVHVNTTHTLSRRHFLRGAGVLLGLPLLDAMLPAFARADTGGCVCPPGLPCACGAVPVGRLLFRGARRPTPEERSRNRRAERLG